MSVQGQSGSIVGRGGLDDGGSFDGYGCAVAGIVLVVVFGRIEYQNSTCLEESYWTRERDLLL